MNVFKYDFRPWKYVSNWPGNIRQCGRNIKYAWQRATRGWCERDVWWMGDYWLEMLAGMVVWLADHGHGYPGKDEWDNPEKWRAYLMGLAEHLMMSSETLSDELYDNPYWEMAEKEIIQTKFEDNKMIHEYKDKEKYDEYIKLWLEKTREIDDMRKEEFKKALDMLKECNDYLWD